LKEEHRLRVIENMVLRKMFGPKRDEVKGEWRRLHNEELYDLYSLSRIVRVIKFRRIRWARNVARMGIEMHTEFWWGNMRDRNNLEVLSLDGMIILKCIFIKCDEGLDWIVLDMDQWRNFLT
jgi:hypothetical protein